MAGFVANLDTAGLDGFRSPATPGLPVIPVGAFEGEPGRGSEGLGRAFVCGVAARAPGPTLCAKGCLAPGPTDWLNCGIEGVVGGERKVDRLEGGGDLRPVGV